MAAKANIVGFTFPAKSAAVIAALSIKQKESKHETH
jgi:hypothetical protein